MNSTVKQSGPLEEPLTSYPPGDVEGWAIKRRKPPATEGEPAIAAVLTKVADST